MPPPTRTAPRQGLTVVEMLLVIVTIGILAGMALSRLDYTRYRADSESRGVMAALAAAQRSAVLLQNDVRISEPDSLRLQVHEDTDNDGVIDDGERVTYHTLDHSFAFARRTAPDVTSPADPTTITSLVFHRDGSASRGGTFYLAGPGYDPDCKDCRAVSLTRSTGRPVWYSYATGTWQRAN
jgi:Tfp pilus assembly protein FimT